MIGCEHRAETQGEPEQAASNARTLRELLRARRGQHLTLGISGDLYLDLSDGPIVIEVGGANQVAGITLQGPGQLIGVDAPTPTTPVLRLVRAPGSIPRVLLRELTVVSNASGIQCVNGGAQTRLEALTIRAAGVGTLDQDGWVDVQNGTCGYGLAVVNSDGLFVRDLILDRCAGHGVVCDRWHAGQLWGCAWQCGGAGVKLQQANGLALDWRAEQCRGYGLHVRDTGIDRYAYGRTLNNAGSPNDWTVHLEACGGRGATGGHGYRFSQAKLENSGRIALRGHSGVRAGQVRLDPVSRESVTFDEKPHRLWRAGDRELWKGLLPDDRPGDKRVSNWHLVWPDAQFRPKIARTSDGAVTITWPIGSLDNVALREVAYWRPFGMQPLASPGSFLYWAEVHDQTGAIADYCLRREGATPRQTPIVASIEVSPVAGDIAAFPLWDPRACEFSGQITVQDTRTDIGLSVNAWAPGMEANGIPQTQPHVLTIVQAKLWKV